LQSELAARVGKEPNNFFYVIKGLEERGLVVKRAAVLQQKKGQSKSTLSTNLIHLAKYAPQGLGETSRVTDGGCTTLSGGVPMFRGASGSGAPPAEADWQSDDEDAAGDDDGMEEDAGDDAAAAVGGVASSFQIVDEDAKLARITTQLVALENHTALERDLKAALGFTSTPGHRQWRRLRALLMRKGCIEQFIGYLAGGRVASFVRLLKPWVAGVGDDGGPAPGDGDDEGILRGVVDAFGHLDSRGEKVAELTIDRQVLAMIAVAGREGLTTAQVDAGLRLNMKRNGPRLEDFKDRFSKAGKDFQVEEASINQGRTILRRYTATPALAEALAGALDGQTEPPVPPPGGWVAGVLEAAAAGLPQHEIDEVLQGNGAGPALGSAPPGPATDGAGPSGAAEPAPAVRPAKKMPAKGKKRKASGKARATRGSDADTKTESSSSDSSSGSETEDERGTAKEALPKGRRLVTEIGQRRRQWLVEKVNSEGLLLTMEVGRVLQNADRASGNMAAIMPDRKVYMRVINAAAAAGEVSVLHVTLPNVQGSMNSRQQTVVARPGTTIDQPGFVESVFQRYRALQKRVRTATHVRQQALNQEQAGFQLPTLAVQPLPAATEHGGALREHRFRAMVANGYATARMLRCRAIHDAAWEIISTRNGPSGDVDPGLVTAAGENRVFLVTRSPDASVTGSAGGGGPSSSGGRLSMLAFSATPEQMELVLTAEELWRGIRVDTYLACLGCASTDQAAVARLRRGNKTLGESAELKEMSCVILHMCS